MPHYQLYFAAEASQTIEVDADNLDDAIDIATAQLDLSPNISNYFDMGDADVLLRYSTVDGEEIEPDPEIARAERSAALMKIVEEARALIERNGYKPMFDALTEAISELDALN